MHISEDSTQSFLYDPLNRAVAIAGIYCMLHFPCEAKRGKRKGVGEGAQVAEASERASTQAL